MRCSDVVRASSAGTRAVSRSSRVSMSTDSSGDITSGAASRRRRASRVRARGARTASTAGPLRANTRGLSWRRSDGGPVEIRPEPIALEAHHRHRVELVRHLDDRDDGVGAARLQQIDGRVDVLGAAQRRRRLQQHDDVGREPAAPPASATACCSTGSIGVSSAASAAGRRNGTSSPSARAASAIAGSSVLSTVRASAAGWRAPHPPCRRAAAGRPAGAGSCAGCPSSRRAPE